MTNNILQTQWDKATEWERAWHGNCVNTYGEQEKQLLYAKKMGLTFFHNGKSPYNIDTRGISIIDIGAGPASLLLKCVGFLYAWAVDPIDFPKWVKDRYHKTMISFVNVKGEDLTITARPFNEAWIYNVLQHTENPEKVIQNAQQMADIIRIFEWIDTPTNVGHIHTLTEENLNGWLRGYGKVEQINGTANCFGKAYYGIFETT